MNQNRIFRTLEDVIAEKGEEWRVPLEHARASVPDKLLSDRNLIRLTKGRCKIPHLELMVKLLYQDSKERPVGVPGIDQFFKVVDHSEFALFDWLEAITYFQNWLESENRKTPFLKMLGYLQCCEESPENKDIQKNFVELVREMIEEHGYVG